MPHTATLSMPAVPCSHVRTDSISRYYCLSLLDKHHHPDIDLERGLKILGMCSDELKRRLPIDFKGLYVKIITKDGIRDEEFIDDKQILPA
jgi:20S proteasome subunit beta 4